jgi:D-serine deaminase-like pyridoxal phosphate-dependent protein
MPLAVGDLLRPRQSEALFLQFGAIVVVDKGQPVEHWPVFPPSA